MPLFVRKVNQSGFTVPGPQKTSGESDVKDETQFCQRGDKLLCFWSKGFDLREMCSILLLFPLPCIVL